MGRVLTLGLLLSLAVTAGPKAGPSAATAQDPPASSARSIRGQVIDAAQAAALRRARVVVSSGSRQIEQVFTDDEGRFAISTSAASPLIVRVSKAGYTPLTATAPGERGSADIRFTLARSVAVMGRVVNALGLPLARAHVIARVILPDGRRVEAESARFFTQTDQLGEYRLGGLPAGRYEIAAVRVPPERRLPGSRVEEQLFGSPELLESGETTAAVALAPGGEANNVDFTIASAPDVTCVPGPRVRPPAGVRTATIRGRVTTGSGEPLACATVRVVAPDTAVHEVFTDSRGRYSIEGLTAGPFVLEARQPGYIALQYGQRRPSDRTVPIALHDEEERLEADFALPRQSFIAGAVVDEHGEPVEGVPVMAFQPRRFDGRIAMGVLGAPAVTDDRGRYRVMTNVPGAYLVATMMRGAVSTGAASRGYTSTWYPATNDFATAGRVTVEAGRDALGIDISVAPRFLATVSGAVVDGTGRPFAGSVSLSASQRSGAVPLDSWSATPDASGAFTIRNVPPGDYALRATGRAGGASPFGMQYVTVIDADPPPVTIVTASGATVEGIVEAPPGANLGALTVFAAGADADYSPARGAFNVTRAAREADGSFRLTGVTGPSRLVVEMPACEGCYLRSAYVNGRDAADTPFDFGVGDAVYRGVQIEISDAAAAIEGRVTSDPDGPGTAGWVVVFAVFPDLWYPRSRHVKIGALTSGNPFRVTGLPPGDYFVAAIPRVDRFTPSADVGDPQVLQELVPRAQRVTLTERERRTLDLTLARP